MSGSSDYFGSRARAEREAAKLAKSVASQTEHNQVAEKYEAVSRAYERLDGKAPQSQ